MKDQITSRQKDPSEMTAIEIARRFTELGRIPDACHAYALVPNGDAEPMELLETAVFLLQNSQEYKIPYDVLLRLHEAGHFCEDVYSVMSFAFYEPNVKRLRSRYAKNCKLLEKYPYLFQKDFPAFEDLPLQFFPYDDESFVPFDRAAGKFEGSLNVNDEVISRNFFRDLDKPILAADVFSQYELEYLCDNVRRSEDIGRENHIYLHYTSWEIFCAYLQVLNLKPLLKQKKIVFLIADEIAQYPIDFKERFHIDYSEYPLRPVGIREVTRLIWHAQLLAHNGGDFFNEIMDAHPNILFLSSIFFSHMEENIADLRHLLSIVHSAEELVMSMRGQAPEVLRELYNMRGRTDKDLMVAIYLMQEPKELRDRSARIVPAIFFQPHFPNIVYQWELNDVGKVELYSEIQEQISRSQLFTGFKYIKTFTPMRRFTTSRAAALRFIWLNMTVQSRKEWSGQDDIAIHDLVLQYAFGRAFQQDMSDRLYHDSVIVRFEDGKLNPAATFRSLAAFLDLPYTETMTYCSFDGNVSADGFRTDSLFAVYEEFCTPSENAYLEYLLRDVYAYYGYGFQFYDGGKVDEAKLQSWNDGFTKMEYYMKESWLRELYGENASEQEREDFEPQWQERLEEVRHSRLKFAKVLEYNFRFINRQGKELRMTPLLQPDPAYLEQELYH